MTFIIISLVSGLVLTALPVYLYRRFRNEWKMPKGVFLRAGLANMLVALFFIAVIDGLFSLHPALGALDPIIKAIFIGIAGGLFYELWRFFVLDKVFRSVRNYKEGIYFALGWTGVLTFLTGLLLIFGSLAITLYMNSDNPQSFLPSEDGETIEILNEQISLLSDAGIFVSLIPVFERSSLLLLDIALTLMMLNYFITANTRFIWRAVGLRACFMAGSLMLQSFAGFSAIFFYILVGILAWKFIQGASKVKY